MSERDIFLAVLDLHDPAARAAYLDRACGGDAALRARVEALLRSHDTAGNFLSSPAVALPGVTAAATQEPGGDATPEDEALPFLTASDRPDSLGRLGHYEVLEVLGRGSFGIVLRAFDEVLQRVVAVKMLAPRLAATSPARKRFLREARSYARVRHENVVQVYAVEEQPLPYLVMEFIPGETLQQRLDRSGPLDSLEVAQIGRQIAEGLAAAHGTGLIHRDIKPGNILLESGPPQRVKITDFGLARTADDASLTQSGIVTGTPLFMSPEQARGESIDARSDLFSLGSVLYTMCSGRPPFRANGLLAVLKRVAEDTPRPIPEVIPEVPPWLCGIIARLHAKKPDDRYASAREVADLLARCLTELHQHGRVRSLPRPPAPAVGRSRLRGQRWAVGAVVVLGLVGLGVSEATGVSNVRGTVIRLFSPEGTLRVERDDPGVSGSVDVERPVASLSVGEQVKAVAARLEQLNPDFDGSVTPTVEDGVVTQLRFSTLNVKDISPVRALPGLRWLTCSGVERAGKLADLSPLRGMQLKALDCNNTQVADLAPLRGMRLKELYVQHTPVRELTPLTGMPLQHLNCSHTPVADLSALKGMKLVSLYLDGTKVADLSALKGMPLRILNCRGINLQPVPDGAVLRSLDALEEINSEPVADFLKKLEAGMDVDRN
jgi:serine/threonine protein kinase